MKEYRLAAWPQLRAPFDRIAHRRMLSTMSQRHVSLAQLADAGGLRRQEARVFVDHLLGEGMLEEREADGAPESLFGSLRPLRNWLRRAWVTSAADH